MFTHTVALTAHVCQQYQKPRAGAIAPSCLYVAVPMRVSPLRRHSLSTVVAQNDGLIIWAILLGMAVYRRQGEGILTIHPYISLQVKRVL